MGRAIVINTCGIKILLCCLLSGRLVGAFDEFAVLECCAVTYQRDQCGAFTARQRDCAASISLYAMAIPVARDPGALGDLAPVADRREARRSSSTHQPSVPSFWPRLPSHLRDRLARLADDPDRALPKLTIEISRC
jgi:hypothetical protein